MNKQDDPYECEYCGRYFYINRINGKREPVQYKCKCGNIADKWPVIPEGYDNHFEVNLLEVN